jgi:SHS2 domain-containing protein
MSATEVPTRTHARSARPRRAEAIGRALALLSALTLVAAAFLPWDEEATLAVDLGVRSLGAGAEQPTVAVILIAVAAVAAIPALVGDRGAPRGLAGLAIAALVIVWLASGPDGVLATGVVVALAGVTGLLLAAALATAHPASKAPDSDDGPASGFRLVDHTADTALEAWGPTRAECFALAVQGLVSSFADIAGARPQTRHEIRVDARTDEDVLVDLLDEVIYVLDVHGAVPVGGTLRDEHDGSISGHLDLTPVADVRHAGAAPKATTYHGLEVTRSEDLWRCRVTVDV